MPLFIVVSIILSFYFSMLGDLYLVLSRKEDIPSGNIISSSIGVSVPVGKTTIIIDRNDYEYIYDDGTYADPNHNIDISLLVKIGIIKDGDGNIVKSIDIKTGEYIIENNNKKIYNDYTDSMKKIYNGKESRNYERISFYILIGLSILFWIAMLSN